MPNVRHLSRAPISEALVDIRVVRRTPFDAARVKALHRAVGGDYQLAEKQEIRAEFSLNADIGAVSPKIERGARAIWFTSADQKLIAQFRADGFTLNRLAPYTSWQDVYAEARRLWRLYRDGTAPESVSRLALRYINKIPVEVGQNLEDVARLYVHVPDELPQAVQALLLRLTLVDKPTGAAVNVLQTLEESPGADNSLSLILDIDAYKEVSVSIDSDEVEAILTQLRVLKNRIFFQSLSETTIERFV